VQFLLYGLELVKHQEPRDWKSGVETVITAQTANQDVSLVSYFIMLLADLLSRPLKKLKTKTLVTKSGDQDLGYQVSRPRP